MSIDGQTDAGGEASTNREASMKSWVERIYRKVFGRLLFRCHRGDEAHLADRRRVQKLVRAIRSDRVDDVQRCLRYGVHLRGIRPIGLELACALGLNDIIEYLLRQGACLNRRCFREAVLNGRLETVRLLDSKRHLRHGDYVWGLHASAWMGFPDLVGYFVRKDFKGGVPDYALVLTAVGDRRDRGRLLRHHYTYRNRPLIDPSLTAASLSNISSVERAEDQMLRVKAARLLLDCGACGGRAVTRALDLADATGRHELANLLDSHDIETHTSSMCCKQEKEEKHMHTYRVKIRLNCRVSYVTVQARDAGMAKGLVRAQYAGAEVLQADRLG